MSGFRENGQKSEKSGRATFLTFFTPNFVPGFGKILGAVSEIIRDTLTHGHTDNTDFIGSSRFSTGYFNLGRGCRQGDPISAYLFIMVMEVFFQMIHKNIAIEPIEIFDHKFLLTSYADDSTFFVKNTDSVHELLKTFDFFE